MASATRNLSVVLAGTCLAVASLLAVPAAGAAETVVRGANNDRGTMVLVAGSAWKGSSPEAPRRLAAWVAPYLVKRGYRVVSIPTGPGIGGAESVRSAVLAEARRNPTQTTCIYGESSGGHVAYLAAMRRDVAEVVDCVVLGAAPTDLDDFYAASKPKPSFSLSSFLSGLTGLLRDIPFFLRDWFGDDEETLTEVMERQLGRPPYPSEWSPARLGEPPFAVSYLREVTDSLVPESQVQLLLHAVGSLLYKPVESTNTAKVGMLNRVHAFVTPEVEAQMGSFIVGAISRARRAED